MSESEGGYEVVADLGLVTIRCRETGQTMTMWADEALGVGRVLAGDDIAALTAEVERLATAHIQAVGMIDRGDPDGAATVLHAATCDPAWLPDEIRRLRLALAELFAQVMGECPSLLNEDSGGDGELALEIEKLLGEGH